MAPPPESTMPFSTMSAASSGGVLSRASLHGIDYRVDRLGDGLPDVLRRDFEGLGYAPDQVPPLDLQVELLLVLERVGRPDADLDVFRRALPDEQVILPLDVLDDGLVDPVARDPDGIAVDNAGEADDRHFGGAAAYIDDHVAASAP